MNSRISHPKHAMMVAMCHSWPASSLPEDRSHRLNYWSGINQANISIPVRRISLTTGLEEAKSFASNCSLPYTSKRVRLGIPFWLIEFIILKYQRIRGITPLDIFYQQALTTSYLHSYCFFTWFCQ